MNLTTMITSGIAATALLAGPVALATPATAAMSTHANTAVQAAPTVKAFPERTIKVRGLVKETRYDHDRDVVEVLRVTQTRQAVTIRGTSKGVQAKVGGKWRYIPYTYNPRTGTLTYNDDVRRDLGIKKDQLTGVNVVTKPRTPKPTPVAPTNPAADAVDIPAYVSDPNLNRTPDAEVIARVGADWRDQLLAGHNRIRSEAGAPVLARCEAADKVAQWKANNMADNSQFSHTSVGPVGTGQVASALGLRLMGSGENIARGYNSIGSVMDGWRGSPGHYANIVDGPFNFVGFGMQKGVDGKIYYAVELYYASGGC